VLRESVSSILPYGSVASDVQAGNLHVRRIVGREIARRLFLVRPAGRPAFQQEAAIAAFMERMAAKLSATLGTAVGHLIQPLGRTVIPQPAPAERVLATEIG
jgi:hypothetical protein